jgi:hypothetical protein
MKEHFVIDPLISKRQQLLLATQLCRMVLKVCIISPYCIVASCMLRDVPLALPSVSVTVLPLMHPLLSPSTLVMTGKWGSDARVVHAQVCGMARYKRQAPLCITCCNTDTLFVTQPRPCMPSSIRALQFSTCLSRLVLTASTGQQCYHCWKRRERLLDVFADLEGQITAMYRIAA